jgi:hypothetical protein
MPGRRAGAARVKGPAQKVPQAKKESCCLTERQKLPATSFGPPGSVRLQRREQKIRLCFWRCKQAAIMPGTSGVLPPRSAALQRR